MMARLAGSNKGLHGWAFLRQLVASAAGSRGAASVLDGVAFESQAGGFSG
mgnify:CR=1 FL=1